MESPEQQPTPGPQLETPYYVVTPPSLTHQWGIYPSIPPCPPPQVSYTQQPHQQQAVQMPTPLYVTFSDGTTMLVPTHRIHDSNQQQQPPPCKPIYSHSNNFYFIIFLLFIFIL